MDVALVDWRHYLTSVLEFPPEMICRKLKCLPAEGDGYLKGIKNIGGQ